jgi:tRNA 2-thiouridine synthesizing protein A
MSATNTVDARGLSCPQPAMMARQAIQKQGKGMVIVLVDSGTSLENVSRLGKSAGWEVTVKQQSDGSHQIVLKK